MPNLYDLLMRSAPTQEPMRAPDEEYNLRALLERLAQMPWFREAMGQQQQPNSLRRLISPHEFYPVTPVRTTPDASGIRG